MFLEKCVSEEKSRWRQNNCCDWNQLSFVSQRPYRNLHRKKDVLMRRCKLMSSVSLSPFAVDYAPDGSSCRLFPRMGPPGEGNGGFSVEP